VDSPGEGAGRTAASPDIAIQLRDLRKVYGDGTGEARAAVDGLTLTVPRGCFFGFLGPNGAGKTTTIKMLMGLAEPTSGSIEILGLRMPADAVAIQRRIGLVPEDTLLFDYLTGVEYLEFAGRIYGLDRRVARERARELISLFDLDADSGRRLGEYSKGMRKRIAMGAALIHRPELFLMDEPFEGVDAVGARLMKDILISQVRRGATVFLTSHVLEVVERLCDRVAILHEGRLLLESGMEELRGGGETLESIFVRTIGGARENAGALEWL
jgi:ABC-2 type transport system ATP-binding protein